MGEVATQQHHAHALTNFLGTVLKENRPHTAASDFGQADVFKILKNEISEYEALAGRKARKETRYRLFLD